MITKPKNPHLPRPALYDEIKNGLLERLLVATEYLSDRRSPFALEAFAELVEQHGEAGLALLGYLVLEDVFLCDPDAEPPAIFYANEAKKRLRHLDCEGAQRHFEEYERAMSRYQGHVVWQCEACGRYRHGRKWKKSRPVPDDWMVYEWTRCPHCTGYGEPTDYEPEPRRNNRNDILAWLLEVEGGVE